MQIEREDRRAVADQNLNGQAIAIAHAAHRVNCEARKILVCGKVLKRPAFGARATRKQQEENENAAAHSLYCPLPAAAVRATTKVSTVSSSVAIVVTMPAVVSTVTVEF